MTPSSPGDAEGALGRTIGGQYQIIRLLGQGGMGAVYLARDTALHRTVALKLIRSDAADAEAAQDRFQQEARLAARLEHPGIVPIYAFGRDGGDYFLAMRYLACETLATRLRREGRLAPA
ncbi:MAG: protein kinase, partial [Gemmatimonadetes bacterium]|nr:protein kinase [Gemmatimonadota bacterium]